MWGEGQEKDLIEMPAVHDLSRRFLSEPSAGNRWKEKVNMMIDFKYLSKGLNALARAHRMNSMAGHLGSSVVAGYFLGEQRPDLDEVVKQGIEDDLDRIMRGESVFGAKMSKNSKLADAELFEAFPKEKADESLIDGIAEALAKSLGQPRQSGHNVIFGSIAIRALKEHPEFATPSVTGGIRKLMTLFEKAHSGSGYYGKAKGRLTGDKVTLPEEDGTPAYDDLEGMAEAVLDEIIKQDASVHRQGYGGLVHVNNHAAAIMELARHGYEELVPGAIASHHRHLRLWRNLPNLVAELGPVKVSKHSAYAAAYWSAKVPVDRALLTHRVKTMYGFDELARATENEAKEKQAFEKLRHLM